MIVEQDQHSEICFKLSQTLDEKLCANDPLTLVFKEILNHAVCLRASDIHFEPKAKEILVRARVHGSLQQIKVIHQGWAQAFQSKLKKWAGLNISKAGIAQDSRFSLKKLQYDVRVNLMPTIDGEKIVFRLLDQSRDFDLAQMGFDMNVLDSLKAVTGEQAGLILISGPTGSGKTTTLYSMLNEIDRNSLNVMSIEDPIEYRLSGMTQVGVTKKHGFSEALRAAMRQDPDVILVGEIRDYETAKLAFQAANTGHLVLSTIHANSAAGIIDRLKGLGIEEDSIKENLIFAGAQRLLKLICPNCRKPSLEFEDFFMRNPEGCDECQSGIIGRRPILSYLNKEAVLDHFVRGAELKALPSSLHALALQLAQSQEVDIYDVHVG